jgi:hypothetical protein
MGYCKFLNIIDLSGRHAAESERSEDVRCSMGHLVPR